MNLSEVNGNVIMSGCVDDNPDDEGTESNIESVSRRGDGDTSSTVLEITQHQTEREGFKALFL